MRLLLFSLLCLLVFLFIRRWAMLAPRSAARRSSEAPKPAASPDEIVDVSFEEHESSGTTPGRGQ
jgi:hypothetical protein